MQGWQGGRQEEGGKVDLAPRSFSFGLLSFPSREACVGWGGQLPALKS